MLRRAIDLGGFHQVIFICHTPPVWELADRTLSVGDGQVIVENSEDKSPETPLNDIPLKHQ